MEPRNQTAVSEFLLMRLTEDEKLKTILFNLFLSMYLVTVLGNLLIILAVISDSHLHGLLSLPSVLYRHWFKHNLDPKDPGEHANTESKHHLHGLLHSDLLCPDFGLLGKFSPWSNGL